MNILYLASFDHSGYGRAAQGDVKALESLGHDITRLDTSNGVVPPMSAPYDLLINRSLPVYWFKSDIPQIGCFAWEAEKLPEAFVSGIMLVDRVVVPCEYNLNYFQENDETLGDGEAIYIPHLVDTYDYLDSINPLDLGIPPYEYKFYSIGDWTERKGWKTLVKTYLSVFNSGNLVNLIIKTNNEERALSDIEQWKREIGKGSKNSPKITLITEFLEHENILGLHKACDCLVYSGHGEGFYFPAHDALALGKEVIIPDHSSSFADLHDSVDFRNRVSWRFGYSEGGGYYKDNVWSNVNEYDLGKTMEAFVKNNIKSKKPTRNLVTSISNVSEEWRKALDSF